MKQTNLISIRLASQMGPLSEYALRRMLAEGRLPGLYVGSKYLVNYPMLLAQIEADSVPHVERREE